MLIPVFINKLNSFLVAASISNKVEMQFQKQHETHSLI